MKKVLIATCCIALLSGSLSVSAQTLAGKSWSADNGNGTFTNPLFYDEFSDPDIIRVGEDYYLAGTTMHSVPGLVVLHSKDLVNWEFSSYCFDRLDDSDDFNLRNGHVSILVNGINLTILIKEHREVVDIAINFMMRPRSLGTIRNIHLQTMSVDVREDIELSVVIADSRCPDTLSVSLLTVSEIEVI